MCKKNSGAVIEKWLGVCQRTLSDFQASSGRPMMLGELVDGFQVDAFALQQTDSSSGLNYNGPCIP
jgi:hypothetical protein